CATLLSEGKSHHLASLRTCLDCADVCSAASHIVARNGVFSGQICTACADTCAKCAAECDKHGNDPIMVQCAKEGRACEQACREMVKERGEAACGSLVRSGAEIVPGKSRSVLSSCRSERRA